MVAVPVAPVEGHDHIGAVTVEAAAESVDNLVERSAGERGGVGSAGEARVRERQQLDVGDAECGGCRPQLRLTELTDATGRYRDVGLDLARLAAGRADDDRAGAAGHRVHQQRTAAERLVVRVRDRDEQAGRRRHETERTKDSISVTISSGTSNIGKWLCASSRRTENHGWDEAYSCCAASTSSAAGWA